MKLFLKGIIIGIGKILPGISGALIAVTFGVYDKTIEIIGKLPKITQSDFQFIAKLGSGIIVSIIISSTIIVKLLNSYYFVIMLLFIILILISFIKSAKHINYKKISNIIIFALGISLLLITNLLTKITITNNIYLVMGIIESLSSIIPGLSGTILLILFGIYNKFLDIIGNMFNFQYLLNNFSNIMVFFISFIFTTLISSKIITYLLNKHKEKTLAFIQGLILASIIIVIKNLFNK